MSPDPRTAPPNVDSHGRTWLPAPAPPTRQPHSAPSAEPLPPMPRTIRVGLGGSRPTVQPAPRPRNGRCQRPCAAERGETLGPPGYYEYDDSFFDDFDYEEGGGMPTAVLREAPTAVWWVVAAAVVSVVIAFV